MDEPSDKAGATRLHAVLPRLIMEPNLQRLARSSELCRSRRGETKELYAGFLTDGGETRTNDCVTELGLATAKVGHSQRRQHSMTGELRSCRSTVRRRLIPARARRLRWPRRGAQGHGTGPERLAGSKRPTSLMAGGQIPRVRG
jgi:hypothetical protein